MSKIFSAQNWNSLSEQYQCAEPFPSICIDNFLTEEFATRVASAYPEYEDAKKVGREFNATNESLKVQITEPPLFPSPVAELSDALSSKEFIEIMSKLSGIESLVWDPSFVGGGMHLTKSSGLLDVHVDFNFESKLDLFRRINILIYLNPVWDKTWGGEVELWDKEVKNCIQSFEPKFNRCVIFSTSDISFHGVTAVQSPSYISRNSFAVYYYSSEPGDNAGDLYGGNHTTIFKARPYEYKKKYVTMPMESFKKTLQQKKRSLKKVLVGK